MFLNWEAQFFFLACHFSLLESTQFQLQVHQDVFVDIDELVLGAAHL